MNFQLKRAIIDFELANTFCGSDWTVQCYCRVQFKERVDKPILFRSKILLRLTEPFISVFGPIVDHKTNKSFVILALFPLLICAGHASVHTLFDTTVSGFLLLSTTLEVLGWSISKCRFVCFHFVVYWDRCWSKLLSNWSDLFFMGLWLAYSFVL